MKKLDARITTTKWLDEITATRQPGLQNATLTSQALNSKLLTNIFCWVSSISWVGASLFWKPAKELALVYSSTTLTKLMQDST